MEYKRIKKNDLKNWLLRSNAKIYAFILIVFLAAVLFMFKTVNNMFSTVSTDDTVNQDEMVEEQESTTSFVEESQTYLIKVNKTNNFITIYKMDSQGDFTQVYKTFRCSVASDVEVGDTTISEKSVWRKLSDSSYYGHYVSKLENSGTISSVPYYAQDISRLNTAAYNNLGNTATIGYIYLASADAQWIYENCGNKVTVSVYEDADEQPAIELSELVSVSAGYSYDPTDENTPVNKNSSDVKIDFMRGVYDCSVALNTAFDEWDGIYAQDINGTNITSKITISGSVDVTTEGTYTLIYYLSDSYGTNLAYYRYVTVYSEEDSQNSDEIQEDGSGTEGTSEDETTAELDSGSGEEIYQTVESAVESDDSAEADGTTE